MADLATIGFRAHTADLDKANKKLNTLSATGEKVDDTFSTLQKTIGILGATIAAVGATRFAKDIADYSESWKMVNNQLRVVIESEAQLIKTRTKLISLSKETNSELEATTALYSELYRNTRELGTAESSLLDVTRTLNNLFQVGGKDAQTQAGAIRQLSQALGTGALRGDEFISVSEAAPRILDALAASLNMAKGELRDFAATGGITSEILINAIESYSDEAQRLADKTEKTFAQSMQNAKTNAIEWAGSSAIITESMSEAGSTIESLSENLDALTNAGEAAIAVAGVGLAVSLAKSTAATIAKTAATAADSKASLQSAKATAAQSLAELGLVKSEQKSLAASLALAQSERTRAAIRLQLSNSTVALVAANSAYAKSSAIVSTATASATASTTALGVATRFLLGPWGLLLTAVGTAAAVFLSTKDESDNLKESIEKQDLAVSELTKRYKDNTAAQLTNTLQKANDRNLSYLHERYEIEKKLNAFGAKATQSPEFRAGLKKELDEVNAALSKTGATIAATSGALRKMAQDGLDSIEWISGLDDADDVVGEVTKEYQKWLDTVNGFQSPLEKAKSKIEDVNDALLSGKLTPTKGVVAYLAAASEELAKFNETAQDTSYRDWIDSITSQTGKLQKLQDEITEVWMAMDAGDIDTRTGLEYIDQIESKIKSLSKTMSGVELFGSVTDSVKESLEAVQDLSAQGSKEYAKLGVAVQAVNAVQAIGAVINQGQGDPYSAFGRMAAMAASMAALGQSIGSLGGGVGDESGANQAAQGQNVWGEKSESIANAIELTADATNELVGINTGMLKALQSMQAGIAGAAGLTARGVSGADFSFQADVNENIYKNVANAQTKGLTAIFGDTLGGIIDSMHNIIPSAIGKLFGGSSKVVDSGIEILGGTLEDIIDGASVFAFQKTKSKKYAWSSTKTHDELVLLQDASTQFELVFDSLADSVFEGAAALGMSGQSVTDAINNFILETTRISLKGLSVEDQQAEIEAVFSAIFDDLAGSVIPFLDEFQMTGEGLGETLARVATQVQIADFAVENLGINLGNKFAGIIEVNGKMLDTLGNTKAYAEAADNLAKLTGGVEDFASKISSFVDDFASDAVKLKINGDALTDAFDSVGLSVPKSTGAFWALMQSLDGTTEAGQEQIAMLLNIQGLAGDYYDLVESAEGDRLAKEIAAANDAKAAIDEMRKAAADFKRDTESFEARFKTDSEKISDAEEVFRSAFMSMSLDIPVDSAEFLDLFEEVKGGLTEWDASLRRVILSIQDEAEIYYDSIEAAEIERLKLAEDTAQAQLDMMQSLKDEAQSAFSMLEKAVALEKTRAQASLDVAREANDAEIARIGDLRTTLDAQKSLLDANLSASKIALTASFGAEKSRLDNVISGLNAEKQAVSASFADRASSISDSISNLTSLTDNLNGAVSSVFAKSVNLDSALAGARVGDFSKAQALDLSNVFSQPGEFGSAADFAFSQAVTANKLAEISDLSGTQKSIEERTLASLESQERHALSSLDAQIASAEEQKVTLDEQLNALLGIDTSTLSMSDAIKQFNEAKLALDELNYDEELSKLDMMIQSADDVYALHEQAYNEQILSLDNLLATNEELLNSTLEINNSIETIPNAIEQLKTALLAVVESNNESSDARSDESEATQRAIAKAITEQTFLLRQIEDNGAQQ